MSEPQVALLRAALAKLDSGGWSLTVGGFARRALKMKAPLSPKDYAACKAAMNQLGLEHRRVPYSGQMLDVWDYQA